MKARSGRLVVALSLLAAAVLLLGNSSDGGCGAPLSPEELCYNTAGSWNGVTCICPADTFYQNGVGCRYTAPSQPVVVEPVYIPVYYDDYYSYDYYYDDYYYYDYYDGYYYY